jgi:hypothetical protein
MASCRWANVERVRRRNRRWMRGSDLLDGDLELVVAGHGVSTVGILAS